MWKRVKAYYQALKFIILVDKSNEDIQAVKELSPISKSEHNAITEYIDAMYEARYTSVDFMEEVEEYLKRLTKDAQSYRSNILVKQRVLSGLCIYLAYADVTKNTELYSEIMAEINRLKLTKIYRRR